MLRFVKEKLDYKVTSVHFMSYESGKVHDEQIGRSTKTKYKEPVRYKYLSKPEKSTVMEHKLKTGHSINLTAPSY
jgi:hypothetical protein